MENIKISNRNELRKKVKYENLKKPLGRFNEYLVEAKVTLILLRELLIEVKELLIILALIAFFVWGVLELISKTHP